MGQSLQWLMKGRVMGTEAGGGAVEQPNCLANVSSDIWNIRSQGARVQGAEALYRVCALTYVGAYSSGY